MPVKSLYISTAPTPLGGVFCEAVFAPNDTVYSKIVFKRKRTTTSESTRIYLIEEVEDVKIDGQPRKKITTIDFRELTNVIKDYLKPKYSLSYLKQMGLQGPPGLVFCMNGEEIHIGKTGIYEVEGVSINNLAFVIKNQSPIPYADNLDYFIMDFYY